MRWLSAITKNTYIYLPLQYSPPYTSNVFVIPNYLGTALGESKTKGDTTQCLIPIPFSLLHFALWVHSLLWHFLWLWMAKQETCSDIFVVFFIHSVALLLTNFFYIGNIFVVVNGEEENFFCRFSYVCILVSQKIGGYFATHCFVICHVCEQ